MLDENIVQIENQLNKKIEWALKKKHLTTYKNKTILLIESELKIIIENRNFRKAKKLKQSKKMNQSDQQTSTTRAK